MRFWVISHAVLMLIASTSLTIFTAFFGDASLKWCYYHMSRSSGFGTEYISSFSPATIWAYLIAFAVGAISYFFVIRAGKPWIGTLGLILSLIGLTTFGNELFQLSKFQHESFLAFSPVLMLVLAVIACIPSKQTKAVALAKANKATELKAGGIPPAKPIKNLPEEPVAKRFPAFALGLAFVLGLTFVLGLVLAAAMWAVPSIDTGSQPATIPLHEAAVHWPEKIDGLVADGASVDELRDGMTPLSMASLFNKRDSVAKLLEHGADPNLKLDRRDAPITILARKGNLAGIQLLLDHGADVNAQFSRRTALHEAVIFDHLDVVDILLAQPNIDLDLQERGSGFSALHFAVMHSRGSIATKLLELGADPDLKDCVGNTPSDLAQTKSDPSLVTLISCSQK